MLTYGQMYLAEFLLVSSLCVYICMCTCKSSTFKHHNALFLNTIFISFEPKGSPIIIITQLYHSVFNFDKGSYFIQCSNFELFHENSDYV